jgi:hypothetical protein
VVADASQLTVREALRAATAGEGGSMLQGNASMTLDSAYQLAIKLMASDPQLARLSVWRKSPWLHIDPLTTPTE